MEKTEIDDEVSKALIREAVEKVYFWQYNYTECFSNKLLDLFPKADLINFGRLALGFPQLALAFELWRESDDQVVFFKYWGVWPEGRES